MVHLVILHHGLWGQTAHLSFLCQKLAEQGQDAVYVLNSDKNQFLMTYDGIDVCADRHCTLIEETVQKLEAAGKHVDKVSFIGYSLGGLVNRYAIGKLYASGFFKARTAANFVTVATPHLGVRKRTRWSLFGVLFNYLVPRFTYRTGRQFVLTDDDFLHMGPGGDENYPLLMAMADPRGPFYAALGLFQKRILFANTRRDFSAPYTTSAIESHNHYTRHRAVIIDAERHPHIVTLDPTAPPADGWTVRGIALLSVFILLSPLALPLLVTLAVTRLGRMQRDHVNNSSTIELSHAWVREWMEKRKSNSGGGKTVVLTTAAELQQQPPSPTKTTEQALSETVEMAGGAERLQTEKSLMRIVEPFQPPAGVPDTKSFADVRQWMVDCLNSLGWSKVEVRVGDGVNGHAAIVVRAPDSHQPYYPLMSYLAEEILKL